MGCVHLKAFSLKLQVNDIMINFCVKCIQVCLVFCKSVCLMFCKKCEADNVLTVVQIQPCVLLFECKVFLIVGKF